jgi:DNA-binding CsgD family transcriptional regulator
MEEQRRRESILYGRAELQAMEACVLFKKKNRVDAFAALREAYETALSNDIIMPFIWLGRDMSVLVTAALKEQSFDIPRPWLEMVRRKSTTFAKHHRKFISDYGIANNIGGEIVLSSLESVILREMYNEIPRSEIATKLNLSISKVKLIINSIYEKLNARSIADVKRIAAERKLV